MSDVVARAREALDGLGDDSSLYEVERYREWLACGGPQDLLDALEQSRTWDGLMALLDEFYPERVFPTMTDIPNRDPGPRIVSLIRYLDQARAEGTRELLTTVAQLDALPNRTVIEVRGELYRRRGQCWRNLENNYDYLPENLIPAVVVWKP